MEKAAKTLLSYRDLMDMGLSRRMAYDLLNRADMPVIQIGSRKFMQSALFEARMAELAQEGRSDGKHIR